jgi:putative NADH-flavin reductase
VSWLTEELVKRGHEVTLFASADSRTAAKLRPMCERNIIQAMARGEAYQYESYAVSALVESLKDAASFDVIHSYIGCAFVPNRRAFKNAGTAHHACRARFGR